MVVRVVTDRVFARLPRNDRTGPIVAMRAINEDNEVMLVTREGTVLRTNLDEIRETGRSTQGVTVDESVKK